MKKYQIFGTLLTSLPLIFFSGVESRLLAQSGEDISKQIWIDFNPTYITKPGLEFFGDVGARTEIEDNGWWRLVVRPSIRQRFWRGFNLIAGVGNFYTFNKTITDRWELRLFQGIAFPWPNWKLLLHHYIRIEERFDFNTKIWNSKNSVRGRYRLAISYRWKAIQPGRYWQVSATGEAFYTFLGEQGQFHEQA